MAHLNWQQEEIIQIQSGMADAGLPINLQQCQAALFLLAAAADPLVQDAIIAQARSAVGSTNMDFGGVTKGTYQAT
jgi:hypothetical protein